MDGSTSTFPLIRLLYCQIMGLRCYWDPYYAPRSINVTDAKSELPNITSTGTHTSYLRLIDSNADLILAARAPNESELDAAKAKGITLEVKPLALDAFVFLANRQNPVNTLSVEAVRNIYIGKVTNWAELGGAPGEIKAFQRDKDSGSQGLMDDLVLKGSTMIEAPDMIQTTMIGPINAVNVDPQAIGYSVYYYATMIFPLRQVKLLSIDGIAPTAETIADDTYPLTTKVFVAMRAEAAVTSTARFLRDWLLSPAGQALVRDSGYVPLPAASVPPARPAPVWSYKVVHYTPTHPTGLCSDETDLSLFNRLGQEGWEYATQIDDPVYYVNDVQLGLTVIFKRLAQSQDRWEYTVKENYNYPGEVDSDNALGREGWEASSVCLLRRRLLDPVAWEYQFFEIDGAFANWPDGQLAEVLNREGAKGWRLYEYDSPFNSFFVFKRPVSDTSPWNYQVVAKERDALKAWNEGAFSQLGRFGWEYGQIAWADTFLKGNPDIFQRSLANWAPWEYKGIQAVDLMLGEPGPLESFLNKMGQAGWEFTNATRYEMLFKRPQPMVTVRDAP